MTIGKGQESNLTREEVIARAQRQLAPYWLKSPPLFFIHTEEDHLEILPLDEEMVNKTWVFLFFDPSTFSGESLLGYSQELDRRYRPHQVRVGIIYHSPYLFFKVKRHIRKWGELHSLHVPVVFDFEGTIRSAFQAQEESSVLIFHQGKTIFQGSGEPAFSEVESTLQSFLRKTDPGLALLPIFSPNKDTRFDVGRVEFGFVKSVCENAEYEGIHFQEVDPATRYGVGLQERITPSRSKKIRLQGAWGQDGERIWTSDPKAVLEFDSLSENVGLVAQPLAGEPKDTCDIEVEVEGRRVYSDHFGSHLKISETGQTLLEFNYPGLFQLLSQLPPESRRITLKFPYADRAPVALYGIRFGAERG